jgi:hypothetical protein
MTATTRLAGLPVAGYDRLGSGSGEMHWRWGTDRQHEGEFFRAEITGAVFS